MTEYYLAISIKNNSILNFNSTVLQDQINNLANIFEKTIENVIHLKLTPGPKDKHVNQINMKKENIQESLSPLNTKENNDTSLRVIT